MQNFNFLEKVVLRTPLKKVETEITISKIEKLFSNPQIQESLFIASPAFQEIIQKNEDFSERKLITAYKYYSRLSNRCTPFGLFASVSTLKTSSKTKVDVLHSKIEKHIKFDMFFLGLLNANIHKQKNIRKHLKFYPNNSIYKVLDKYRYVEFYYENNKRFHRISEVSHNQYLEGILYDSANGKTITELSSNLASDEITLEEGQQFIESIINAQFLVSELDISLTGEDYLDVMIKFFNQEKFNFKEGVETRNLLKCLKNGLIDLEATKVTFPKRYLKFFETIKTITREEHLAIKKLFQVDTFRNISEGSISYHFLKKIRQGIVAMNKLSEYSENSNLLNFKRKFIERYENEMLPICQVMDPDSGIGYNVTSGAKTPLLNGLLLKKIEPENEKIKWGAKQRFLVKKILHAYRNNYSSIDLDEKDLNQFTENTKHYPESFSVFFSIFNEDNTEKVLLKTVAGPSANNLIGRFGYLSESLLEISNEICEIEKKGNPDKILAEVIHLPEARTGNILHRKFQRDYEIPYLAQSLLDKKNQIHLNDLYVTVRNNKIVLFSKKLNKEITPRLGNAHNFTFGSLPIYYFLCDMQNQESNGFSFSWGSLSSSFTFLPRLSYKGVILSKAKWNFKKEDFESIFSDNDKLVSHVKAFAKTHNLPDLVVLTEGDNEILINFKNDLSCTVFHDMAKSKHIVSLQEFLMKDSLSTEGYANEFIAFATKNEQRKKNKVFTPKLDTSNHSFSVGSNWVYFKLYCGHSSAEEVLKKAIAPTIQQLRNDEILDKWFFIRYNDKYGHHLRVRIQLFEANNISKVTYIVRKYLKYFTEQKIVWKVQLDTYIPEAERYGYNLMNDTELVFQYDSDCTLQFIDMIEGDEGEKIRWLFSLLSINSYLDDFGISEKEKMNLLQIAKEGFGSEFEKSKLTNKKINSIYNENANDILPILEIDDDKSLYAPLKILVKNRSTKIKPILQKIIAERENIAHNNRLLISHIHMICNRIFMTKQREHEAVVYDLLYQYYKRKKYKTK